MVTNVKLAGSAGTDREPTVLAEIGSTKLKGGGNVQTSIKNGKVFEPAWTDPVGPNPEATKAVLQAEYGTRAKRVEKLCINLSMAYGLVLGQCTDYLRSRLERQEKW